MGPSSRRLAATFGSLLLGAILAAAGAAQSEDDPRNSSDAYWDAVDGAKCADHHYGEGFRPFGLSFTEQYSQLPVGEEVVIEVRVRHNTRMTEHIIQDVVVLLNLSEAPNVRVVTADSGEDVAVQEEAHVTYDKPYALGFPVYAGAVEGRVTVRLVETEPGDILDGEWQATVHGRALEGGTQHRTLKLTPEILASHGPGEWPLAIRWEAPTRDLERALPLETPVAARFEIAAWVNHSAAATEYSFKPAEEEFLRLKSDPPTLVQIPIVLTRPGTALLDFRVEAKTVFFHPPAAKLQNAGDEGTFHRFITMQVRDGPDVGIIQQSLAPVPAGPAVDLYHLFTRVLGFIGLLLVITALLSGGVLGRASRRTLNRVTGGARRRVLFHGATGFLIIVVASAHFLVALIETRNAVSHGLLWGGIAWLLLITLGFTGYYQTRMIKRFGYRTWRHVHLWSAVAVLVFILIHVVLEGSALSTLRESFPAGYERLLWPRAP